MNFNKHLVKLLKYSFLYKEPQNPSDVWMLSHDVPDISDHCQPKVKCFQTQLMRVRVSCQLMALQRQQPCQTAICEMFPTCSFLLIWWKPRNQGKSWNGVRRTHWMKCNGLDLVGLLARDAAGQMQRQCLLTLSLSAEVLCLQVIYIKGGASQNKWSTH